MKTNKNGRVQLMEVKKFYEGVAKYDAERQKSEITKKYISENIYFMMYTEKLDKFLYDECQLTLICAKDGLYFLGYSFETEGFPFGEVVPRLKQKIELSQISSIKVDSNTIELKGDKLAWKFRFHKNTELLAQWIVLIYRFYELNLLKSKKKTKQFLKLKGSYYSILGRSYSELNKFLFQQFQKEVNQLIIFRQTPDITIRNTSKQQTGNQVVDRLRAELNQTREKLAIAQDKYDAIVTKLSVEEQFRKKLVQEYSQQMVKTSEQFKTMESSFNQIKKIQKSKGNIISFLKVQNQKPNQNVHIAMSELAKSHIYSQQLEEKVKKLEREVTALSNNIQDLQHANKEILQNVAITIEQYKTEKRSLEEKLLQGTSEKQTIQTYQIEINSLKDQISVLKNTSSAQQLKKSNQAQEHSSILKGHLDEIHKKDSRIKLLVKNNHQLQTLKENQDQIIYQKSQENITLKQDLVELNKKLSANVDTQQKQFQMQAICVTLRDQVQNKTEKLKETESELIKVKDIVQEKDKMIEKAKQKHFQLQNSFKSEKGKLQIELKSLQEQNCQDKGKNLQLLKEIQKLEENQEEFSAKNDEKIELLSKLEIIQKQKIELQSELHKNRQENLLSLKQKQEELQEKVAQQVEVQSQLEGAEKENKNIQNLLEKTQRQNQRMMKKLEEEKRVLNNELIKAKRQKGEVVQKQKRSQQEIRQLTSHRSSLQKQKLQVDQELKKSMKQVDELKQKILSTQREKGEVQEKLRESVNLFNEVSQNMSSVQRQKLDVEERFRQYSEKAERQMVQLEDRIKNDTSKLLFHGQVLEFHQEYKLFIRDSIQNLRKKTISRTVQIFASDALNPTSYHKYIDDVPDIVLIVKTESGVYFGGYSQSPMNKDKVANKSGLLMSLTNKKVYHLMEGKRSITYDNYFLIFGNSEIRIKQGQWKVFSNFAIANGFFNPMGNTIDNLLSAGKEREILFARFQIHRVFFEEEKGQ